ncbi:MAG: uroporphyrinogen-III C-methyltransferase [Pasteurellaceae bacterium]|nr:uroporphyrinogen-III C-methyltransferase [Pasteurellaceae bacterium]
MAKHNKKQHSVETEQVVDDVNVDNMDVVEAESLATESPEDALQGGRSSEKSAKSLKDDEPKKDVETVERVAEKKSGSTAIALLALLVALGIGGVGYYCGKQKVAEVDQQIQQLTQNVESLKSQAGAVVAPAAAVEMPTFEAEKAQIAKLESEAKKSVEQLDVLQRQQGDYAKQVAAQINGLQAQLQQLGSVPKADTTVLLISDADFLLTNALRKVVIDNDLDTAKSLLIEADNALSQVNDPQIATVREAIKADLNLLSSLNKVDQNNLMQRLAQLANLVDDMPMLDNEQLAGIENGEVSDSLADWQQNIEKSANSFLNRFIRISDKNKVQDKAFIAPNQEIYLRENIRLRLQIAILTVPRQQNELYKQSLEAVSTWVRSYFDVQNENVKTFLKEVDDLIEQSIYIDAPATLQSLNLLKQKLNRLPQAVEKIQLDVDKAVEELKIDKPAESEQAPAEQKQ